MHLIQHAHEKPGYSIRELLDLFNSDKGIPIDTPKTGNGIITAPENGCYGDAVCPK